MRRSVRSAFGGASERVLEGLAEVEFRARLSVPLTQAMIELHERRRAARTQPAEPTIVAYRGSPSGSPAQPPSLSRRPLIGAHANGGAANGPVRARRAAPFRLRYALVVGAAVLCLGGGATATSLWLAPAGNPLYGFNPGLSSSAPPAAQLAALAVLRRPQTDAERGPDVRSALTNVNNFTKGLRSDYVRVLERTVIGPVVLIPVQTRDAAAAGQAPQPTLADDLCVYYPFVGSSSASADTHCWTTAQLMAGGAFAGGGNHEYGLVPDGVRSVHVALGAWERSVPVAGNFFDVTLPVGGGTSGAASPLPVSPAVMFSGTAR